VQYAAGLLGAFDPPGRFRGCCAELLSWLVKPPCWA